MLAVVALAGCGGGGGETVPYGSLHGTVTRGPTSPVCRQGTPCTEPASDTRIVFVRNNTMVAQPIVEEDGRYTVLLPAGTYFVSYERRDRAQAPGRGMTPRTVRVVYARTRKVDFQIDTGIR